MFDEWYVVVTSTYHQHVDMLIGDKEPTCQRWNAFRKYEDLPASHVRLPEWIYPLVVATIDVLSHWLVG